MQAPDSLPAQRRPQLAAHWRFLLLAAGLYVLWLVVYEGFVLPDGKFDAWLSAGIASTSTRLLQMLGFAATNPPGPALVYINGLPAVVVWAPCDGLALYALFTGFVLAFPSRWQPKLWFIPVGIAVIFVLNVVRVAALALNHLYSRSTVDFNHHYTFTFVVYACIGAMWVWWVRKYGSVGGDPAPAA